MKYASPRRPRPSKLPRHRSLPPTSKPNGRVPERRPAEPPPPTRGRPTYIVDDFVDFR